MLYGISTSAYYSRLETEDALRLYAESGRVDCAEVFFQCEDECDGILAPALLAAQCELPATSIHVLNAQMEVGLFSESMRQRQDSLNLLENAFRMAEKLGATRYVFHGQNLSLKRMREMSHAAKLAQLGRPIPVPTAPDYDKLAERVYPVVHRAAAHGIGFAWETVAWSTFHEPGFAREMVKRMPDIGFTLDIKQAAASGYSWREYLDAMRGRLLNVHVCDMNEAGENCMPCQGDFNFAEFAAALRDAGYSGPIILEPYPQMFQSSDSLFDSLDALRAQMG